MSYDLVHLSQPQQRIWITQNIYPQSPMYNIGGTVTIHGCIDIELLKQAIELHVSEHDAFQIHILYKDQIPMQYFCLPDAKVGYIDFSTLGEGADNRYKVWETRQAQTPFNMIDSDLYQFYVFKIKDDTYGYFVKLHHIIADGWSFQLLTDEIHKNYMLLQQGGIKESSQACQYKDYLLDEQKYLSSSRYQKDRQYWMELLQDINGSYDQAARYIDGTRYSFPISDERWIAIREFCHVNDITLNSLIISLYILYNYKEKGSTDIVIGIPVLGRNGKKQLNTLGMFVSTMPFTVHVDPLQTVIDLIHTVNLSLLKGYAHQRYPYNHLTRDKSMLDQVLFEDSINYYGTDLCKNFDVYPAINKEFYNGYQAYAVQIIVREWTGQEAIQLDIDASNSLYSRSQVMQMFDNLMKLIDSMLSVPNNIILSLEEKVKHLDFFDQSYNQTTNLLEPGITVINLFERMAIKHPDRIALECDNESITYRQFRQKIYQICAYLEMKNIDQGSVIGIIATHSIEMLAAIWGILTYGCTLLLIDYKMPLQKIDFLLNDAGAAALFTNLIIYDITSYTGVICNLKDVNLMTSKEMVNRSDCEQLAYILYTSGSTGIPKGVQVTHKNLFNYICWASDQYIDQKSSNIETFALFTSIAFDLTITTLFTPLVNGGKIIIYPEREDEYALFRILDENRCTTIKLTPSQLTLIQNRIELNSTIKRLIVGGEDLKTTLANRINSNFGGKLNIINEYGPTEATVGCMIHQFDPKKDLTVSVPIGKPAWNTKIYILDENMQDVTIGAVGEIYIAGDSVTSGYLGQSELTEKSFLSSNERGRLYRTGDMARFINENTVIFCGRVDSQVKIRGHRIEVKEIEAVLEKHTMIDSAYVTAMHNNSGTKYLCAYYTAKSQIPEDKLREFLQEHIQSYMIPSRFLYIEKFTFTSNGKLDTDKLPAPKFTSVAESDINKHPLLSVSASILGVESIDFGDNFYKLGGDSITAIQISSKLRDIGNVLSVKSILNNPVFRDMAGCIEYRKTQITDQGICEGEIERTPILNWYFSQPFQNASTYCQQLQLRFTRPISFIILEQALMILTTHHDILRVNINENKNLFYNNNHLDSHITIEEYNITDSTEDFNSVLQRSKLKLIDSIDLYSGLLLRSCLISSEEECVWCIILHHLVTDGVSLRIIINDLSDILHCLLKGQAVNLPAKTTSYQQYSNLLAKSNIRDEFSNRNTPLRTNLPKDDLIAMCILDEEKTEMFSSANCCFSTKTAELMLAGLLQTLISEEEKQSWILQVEDHGRSLGEDIDVSRTVGWFTNIRLKSTQSYPCAMEGSIIWCKEAYRSMQKSELSDNLPNSSKYNMDKTIRFNYLGNHQFKNDLLQVDLVFSLENEIIETVEFDALVVDKRMMVCVRIKEEMQYYFENAQLLLDKFMEHMTEILEFCTESKEKRFTPSDFTDVQLSQDELDALFY